MSFSPGDDAIMQPEHDDSASIPSTVRNVLNDRLGTMEKLRRLDRRWQIIIIPLLTFDPHGALTDYMTPAREDIG